MTQSTGQKRTYEAMVPQQVKLEERHLIRLTQLERCAEEKKCEHCPIVEACRQSWDGWC